MSNLDAFIINSPDGSGTFKWKVYKSEDENKNIYSAISPETSNTFQQVQIDVENNIPSNTYYYLNRILLYKIWITPIS